MSFLETISFGLVKNEKENLRELRDAAEGWYNEISTPFMPVLLGHEDSVGPTLSNEERTRLAQVADAMFANLILANSGNAVKNRMAELSKSRGIPFFSGRKELREKADLYLRSGEFVKKFIYSSFSDMTASASDYQSAVREARAEWEHFRDRKDEFIAQINNQLARI